MQKLLFDKLCNALITDTQPSEFMPAMALGGVGLVRKLSGGLWVGGRVKASAEALTFTPNGMNTALHTKLEAVQIPLATIRAVRREFGWLTGIVVVEHARGELRFRCFGATSVARVLSAHVPGP